MRDFEQDIRPGIGLGPLILGVTEQDVRELLGAPSSVEHVDYGDGYTHHIWEYEALHLSLTFDEDEDYRLGCIRTAYEWATLGSSRIIGISQEELLVHPFEGIGPPEFDEDFEESGREYDWEELNLSCWVDADDDTVVSVSIMPLYDDTGEIPQWPR